ncbi:MAG: prenyltransferase [Anaerolineae bacterium]
MSRLKRRVSTALALIRLGRLHFLVGGFVLHGLGIAIALYQGAAWHPLAFLWGQIVITATQIMTHYANDYFDLAADRANQTPTQWSGGSRVLVEGALPPSVALRTAQCMAIIALAANLILSVLIRPGVPTFLLLAAAQAGAWFYSAPPLSLHSRGLGELAVIITVPLLTPLTGYYLQAGHFDLLPLLAVVPLCAIQGAMLLAIEFPDAEGDRAVGKRTLVIRLGAHRAKNLYVFLVSASFVSLPVLVAAGLPPLVGLAAAAFLPLALMLLWQVHRGDWRMPQRWNRFGFHTILLLMGGSAAECAAFILLIGLR